MNNKKFIKQLKAITPLRFIKVVGEVELVKPNTEKIFKCGCGKIELERYAQPLSADPYSPPICRWCFDEAVLKGKPFPNGDLVEKILKEGFDYGYFSNGKLLKKNLDRRKKAKAEISKLLAKLVGTKDELDWLDSEIDNCDDWLDDLEEGSDEGIDWEKRQKMLVSFRKKLGGEE